MAIIKIAIIGVGGAMLAMIIRQFKTEYSIMILLGICIFLLSYLTSNVAVITEFMQKLTGEIPYSNTYYRTLFKLLAIAYVCQTASVLCADLGYESISFQIDTIGKITMMVLSIPIMESLLELIKQLLS